MSLVRNAGGEYQAIVKPAVHWYYRSCPRCSISGDQIISEDNQPLEVA